MAEESASGAVAATEAAVIDAAVVGAETAQTAAQAALTSAAHVAETAAAATAEHAAEIEQRVGEAVADQNNQIAGLTEHISQVREWQTQTHSHLQTITERQSRTETALEGILALLTPKPSPETTAETPAESLPSEGAEGQKAAETKPVPERPKHRWI